MAELFVEINRQEKTARFFGPGTFAAKDKIKELGNARWMREEKSWVVSSFAMSSEELEKVLPQVSVLEEEKSARTEKEGTEKEETNKEEKEEGVSVSQLVKSIDSALSKAFPKTVLVYGVISSLKRYGKRVYLSLAEAERPDESLDCVIWNNEDGLCAELHKAGFKLEPDLQVMFEVSLGLNRKRGSISLSVSRIIAEYTTAKLAAQRELTNTRLKKEGLFDRNKQKELPFLPQRLGVLTSSGGTVIHDFMNSLNEAEFGFEVFWAPVSVQGKEAKQSIVAGISALQALEDLDVILLFRGGGSAADLSVFNDYEVARAICQSNLPIVSAIGHQEDQSSAQDVSFLALGVPKDVGRYFADLALGRREALLNFQSIISEGTEELLNLTKERLEALIDLLSSGARGLISSRAELFKRTVLTLPSISAAKIQLEEGLLGKTGKLLSRLGNRRAELAQERVQLTHNELLKSAAQKKRLASTELRHRVEQLKVAMESRVSEASIKLGALERIVSDASPEVQLKRGYSLVRSEGKYVTTVSGVSKGQSIEVDLSDGSLLASVENKGRPCGRTK